MSWRDASRQLETEEASQSNSSEGPKDGLESSAPLEPDDIDLPAAGSHLSGRFDPGTGAWLPLVDQSLGGIACPLRPWMHSGGRVPGVPLQGQRSAGCETGDPIEAPVTHVLKR